jgi:hypothetical protein
MNLLTIRSQARLKSGVNANDYSNTNLDAQIDVAYKQLATMLANLGEDYFEEQNTTFDLVARSSLYSLPTDFMAMKQTRLAYSTPSTEADFRVATPYDPAEVHDVPWDEINVPTTNPIVDITGNYFRIRPKPVASVSGGGRLWYIAMPSSLATTAAVPVIPIQYHDKLAVYAAKEMTFKYEKWAKHGKLDAEWNSLMTELENKIADRDLNKPVRFKTPFEVGRPGNVGRRELPN